MSHTDDTTLIITPNQADQALAAISDLPASKNPALVYIASLSERSKRTQIHSLNTIAEVLDHPVATRLIPDARCADVDQLQPSAVTFHQTGSWDEIKAQFEAEKRGGQHQGYRLENVTWIYVRWESLRYEHTQAIRARLAERLTPGGANKALAALRRVLKESWRLGYMSAEDYYRARDIENVTGTGESAAAGRALSAGEIAALIDACHQDRSAAGARDAAIIALMYITGARRASVVQWDMKDYDPDTGRVVFRKAKRNKTITVYIANGAKSAIDDWLTLRGDHEGPIFQPVSQTGEIERHDSNGQPRRMTPQAIYAILTKRAGEAGVKHFSPHDLRRTLAGDLIDAGADIATVQKILGHASINTTARYDRRPEKRKREAVDRVHVPYRRHAALDAPQPQELPEPQS